MRGSQLREDVMSLEKKTGRILYMVYIHFLVIRVSGLGAFSCSGHSGAETCRVLGGCTMDTGSNDSFAARRWWSVSSLQLTAYPLAV